MHKTTQGTISQGQGVRCTMVFLQHTIPIVEEYACSVGHYFTHMMHDGVKERKPAGELTNLLSVAYIKQRGATFINNILLVVFPLGQAAFLVLRTHNAAFVMPRLANKYDSKAQHRQAQCHVQRPFVLAPFCTYILHLKGQLQLRESCFRGFSISVLRKI